MNYSYKFPAVKGVQGKTEYFVSMVPLGLLDKLFPVDDDIVQPEFRAQRRVNEARIPVISKYILDNRDSYVFSALAASIDGEFEFSPSDLDPSIGMLEISMNSVFLINDGQHRKSAILSALKEDPSLNDETISIVFYADKGLERSQQIFTDLNKNAVRTSNSLAALYDSRDDVAVATRSIIDQIPFLKKYTDKERDILGKNSSKLFTLITMCKANKRILHNSCNEDDRQFLFNYWNTVVNNISEWRELEAKEITKKDLKENYIVSLAITINAFGKLGKLFYEDRSLDMKSNLSKLKNIDWHRNNEQWIGIVIREDGKVMNSEESINLTYKKIKEIIGL